MMFWYGLAIGIFIMFLLHLAMMKSYKKVLQRAGEYGGWELINGVWYRITKENGRYY